MNLSGKAIISSTYVVYETKETRFNPQEKKVKRINCVQTFMDVDQDGYLIPDTEWTSTSIVYEPKFGETGQWFLGDEQDHTITKALSYVVTDVSGEQFAFKFTSPIINADAGVKNATH